MGAANPAVAGVQPATLQTPSGPVRVHCCMSVPRLGWQDHMFCWARGLIPYGISPIRMEGAFWGQCLERVLTDIVEADEPEGKPPLWILTLDYDSIFSADAVPKLLTYAVASGFDFVAAIQMKRRTDEPLFTMVAERGERMAEVGRDTFIYHNVVKANTAPFGLTMLKAESLKKMEHPWFIGKPNADGRWEDGRIDDDIAFWLAAQKAGLKIGVCPRVSLGHAEVWIKWPDQSMKASLQHPGDFWERGGKPPDNVWQ